MCRGLSVHLGYEVMGRKWGETTVTALLRIWATVEDRLGLMTMGHGTYSSLTLDRLTKLLFLNIKLIDFIRYSY